jgi:hypothetical protein
MDIALYAAFARLSNYGLLVERAQPFVLASYFIAWLARLNQPQAISL